METTHEPCLGIVFFPEPCGWGVVGEVHSGPGGELPHHVPGAVDGHVGALGEILADESVEVLVGAASPEAGAALYLAVVFTATVTALGNTDTSAALIQKGCSDYTEFVLNRTEVGMDTKTIDKLWNEHAAPKVDADDRWNTEDTCGTVESIAAYVKTK